MDKKTKGAQFIEKPPARLAKQILKLSKKNDNDVRPVKNVHFSMDNTNETEEIRDTNNFKKSSKKVDKRISKRKEKEKNDSQGKLVKKTNTDMYQLKISQESTRTDKDTLNKISFEDLEKYNLTKFPWPIKNKYLALLKISNFPFKKLGIFKNSEPKKAKKSHGKGISDLIEDTLEEANELFTKAGYEDALIQWLAHYWNKNPDNPKRHILKQSPGEDEFNRHLDELKSNIAYENKLAFELQQIKLLCGMIDEESYGLDGTEREQWDKQIEQRAMQFKHRKLQCLSRKLKLIKEEIQRARQRILMEKKIEKQKKREQILKDLQLWKNYVSPKMEGFLRDKNVVMDDGRIKDWFECVHIYGKGIKEVCLLDEYEMSGESESIFDQESVENEFEFLSC